MTTNPLTSSSKYKAYLRCISGIFDFMDILAISNANSKALLKKSSTCNKNICGIQIQAKNEV